MSVVLPILVYGWLLVVFLLDYFNKGDNNIQYGSLGSKTPPPPQRSPEKQLVNLTDEQISAYIERLREKLPGKITAENRAFEFEPSGDFGQMSTAEKEAQLVAYTDAVSKFLLLPHNIHLVFIYSMTTAAKPVWLDDLYHLQIHPGLLTKQDYKLVLLRYITLYYLQTHKFVISDPPEDPIFTEMASIYLGFGFSIHSTAAELINQPVEMRPKPPLCLLTPDAILRSIIATAHARQQQPYELIDKLIALKMGRKWATRRLHDLIKTFEAGQQTNT